MNDKDKEAFEKWNKLPVDQILTPVEYREFLRNQYEYDFPQKAWEAACEYKQKEIDELNSRLAEATDIIQEIVDSDDDRYNRPRYYSKCKEFLV